MQAAVHTPSSPILKIEDKFEIPKPGPDQVLIQVQASGVCHSDVFILSQFPDDKRTYIMGHECSGIAVELGSNVKGIHKHKRYAVQSIGGCAACIAKQSGVKIKPGESAFEEFFSLPFFGIGGNGGHAEYAVVDAKFLVPVPDGVTPDQAAVAADAGITAWHAIKTTAEIKKGEKVLITGIGGLGLLAVQMAVYLGAEVYAVDMRPSSRELALKFGAKAAFDLPQLDAELAKDFSVDCAVDFVSTDTTFTRELTAVSKLELNTEFHRSGRVVIVGVSDQNLISNVIQNIVTAVQIRFSVYGVKQDIVEVLDLIEKASDAKGHIKPVTTKMPLHKANEAYNQLRANLVLSRAVLIPPKFWEGSQ